MTIDELCELVLKEFTILDWKLEKQDMLKNQKDVIVASIGKNRYQFSLGQFHESVYEGSQYISTSFDSEKRGSSNPCKSWEESKEFMNHLISQFDQKLLEEQQLSLF